MAAKNGTILAIFYLQVTPMLPTKFQVNWSFGSGGEAKNTLTRWPQWRPAWISAGNNFTYFWSTSHPDASYSVKSIGLSVQEKKRKIHFQDGRHGGHLWFLIRMILAIFDLQVDTSYQISSQLAFQSSRRREKQIFKMVTMEAILDFQLEQFQLFFIYKSPRCFLPSFKPIGLLVQEEKQIMKWQTFKMAAMVANLDFQSERF